MKKEIEVDTAKHEKYTIEGETTLLCDIKINNPLTFMDSEGLIYQKNQMSLRDLFDIIDVKEGDRVRITVEKLEIGG